MEGNDSDFAAGGGGGVKLLVDQEFWGLGRKQELRQGFWYEE